ncbi:integrase arm-type DNA-binding domain-containing protein [Klebsiella variicola]|uniref:integrase arm-type DNA-binding domain-containing protein n=1 Tax=Klebsiella variicola TaxID=244366 RepID=UPI001F169B72|nr:integrase arm-type DNA-binding domain-containing protein [Klebsiella variicola]MCE7488935.1 integrase arm-type DNA-binding domain-containing protein [Klebsiella variicola]
MPKIIRPFTDAEVRGAKAKERDFSLFDGGGLLLYVKTTGSKIWRLRYYQPYTRKRHTLTIGSYPEIRLQEARQKREEARLMLARGIDPNAVKRESAREAKEALDATHSITMTEALDAKSLPHTTVPGLRNEIPVPTGGDAATTVRYAAELQELWELHLDARLRAANPKAGARLWTLISDLTTQLSVRKADITACC